MIRTWIFLGVWAALPLPGQVGSAALYTEFTGKPSPAVVQSMQEEVDSLMAPNSLHFVWRMLPESSNAAWTELAVLKFSGRCEILPLTNSRPVQRLGWTHMSDRVILPFAEIDCDAIRTFVFRELSTLAPSTREAALGRAVGRVVAHELLHIFAETPSHSDHGVDHPSLSPHQLLTDHLEFAELEPTAHIVHTGKVLELPSGSAPQEAGRVSYNRGGCTACHGSNGDGTPHGPALRFAKRKLNSIVLFAKLAKNQDKMCQRARALKVARPSIGEDEITQLVRFLNEF